MVRSETQTVERDAAPATISRRTWYLAVALILVPFLVSAVTVLLDGSGALIRDQALTEMQVRDVGVHPVLSGLYSRSGWSHPGPLLFYSLAVPYRLLGSGSAGLLVGALTINALAIVGMAALAKRLGGTPAALLTLVGVGVLGRAMGTDILRDPWVCFVTVIPFGLFCLLTWAMAAREVWALPAAAALASWLVQTHVGFAPLTGAALVVGGLFLLIAAIRSHEPGAVGRVLRAAGLAAVIVLVLWIPPIWGELFRYENLRRLVDWFWHGAGEVHTLTDGVRVVFGQLTAAPGWVTGDRGVNPYNGETTLISSMVWPVLLVPVVAGVVVAWRRRDRAVLRLAAVVGFMTVVSVVAIARTIGIVYEYRLLWTWVIGMLAAVVLAWTVWNVSVARWPGAERKVLTPLALVTIAVLSVVQTGAVVAADPFEGYSPATRRVTGQLADQLDPHGGQVVLRSETAPGGWLLQGLLVGLEKDGFDVRVPDDPYGIFGRHRRAGAARPQARLVVLTDGDIAARPPAPGLELVAYSGPVPLERRLRDVRAAQAEQARLGMELDAGQISVEAFNRAFAASKPHGVAFAVYRER